MRDAGRPATPTGEYTIPYFIYCDAYPVRDGRLRRPRAAGHDVSRAPRLHLAARPADLGLRRAGRCDPPAGRRSPIATCGRSRTCWSSSARGSGCPAFVDRRRRAAISRRLRGLSSSTTSARPASACSPAGAARTATRPARRAEPGPARELHRERLLLASTSSRPRQQYIKHANRGYLDCARAHGLHRQRATRSCCSSTPKRCRDSVSPRRARRRPQPPEHHRARIETYFDPLPFWYPPLEERGDRRGATIPLPRSRSGRWRCTTRGVRRTRGCARSTATTSCT